MTKSKSVLNSLKLNFSTYFLIFVFLIVGFFLGVQFSKGNSNKEAKSPEKPDSYIISDTCYSKDLQIKLSLRESYYSCAFNTSRSAPILQIINNLAPGGNTNKNSLGFFITKGWGKDQSLTNCDEQITSLDLGSGGESIEMCTDQNGSKTIQKRIPTGPEFDDHIWIIGGPYKEVTEGDIADLKLLIDSIEPIGN